MPARAPGGTRTCIDWLEPPRGADAGGADDLDGADDCGCLDGAPPPADPEGITF